MVTLSRGWEFSGEGTAKRSKGHGENVPGDRRNWAGKRLRAQENQTDARTLLTSCFVVFEKYHVSGFFFAKSTPIEKRNGKESRQAKARRKSNKEEEDAINRHPVAGWVRGGAGCGRVWGGAASRPLLFEKDDQEKRKELEEEKERTGKKPPTTNLTIVSTNPTNMGGWKRKVFGFEERCLDLFGTTEQPLVIAQRKS